MLFYPASKKDIKEVKTCLKDLQRQVQDIHKVIYVDGNGNSFQTRLVKAEKTSTEAIRVATTRTTAMWTVMAFALLAIGGMIGYQMLRIDCLFETTQKLLQQTIYMF